MSQVIARNRLFLDGSFNRCLVTQTCDALHSWRSWNLRHPTKAYKGDQRWLCWKTCFCCSPMKAFSHGNQNVTIWWQIIHFESVAGLVLHCKKDVLFNRLSAFFDVHVNILWFLSHLSFFSGTFRNLCGQKLISRWKLLELLWPSELPPGIAEPPGQASEKTHWVQYRQKGRQMLVLPHHQVISLFDWEQVLSFVGDDIVNIHRDAVVQWQLSLPLGPSEIKTVGPCWGWMMLMESTTNALQLSA